MPRYVPHKEINTGPSHTLECALVRSDNEAVVVNITDIEPAEKIGGGLLGRSDPLTPVTLLLACTKINSASARKSTRRPQNPMTAMHEFAT